MSAFAPLPMNDTSVFRTKVAIARQRVMLADLLTVAMYNTTFRSHYMRHREFLVKNTQFWMGVSCTS